MMLGNWLTKKRLEKDLTIKDICLLLNEQPQTWSKIERNISPLDNSKLEFIAEIFEIKDGTSEYKELFELAKNQSLTTYDEEKVLDSLPAFLRTVENVKPSVQELDALIELVKAEKV